MKYDQTLQTTNYISTRFLSPLHTEQQSVTFTVECSVSAVVKECDLEV